MRKLYACIISPDVKRDKDALLEVAQQFSFAIEGLPDGILFDISGLERLMGRPERIGEEIIRHLKVAKTPGHVAVANNAETAMLLARAQSPVQNPSFSLSGEEQAKAWTLNKQAEACTLNMPDTFTRLPLAKLDIEQDTLNVFSDLGIHRVEDLLAVPNDDLVNRYGREFENVIRTIRQKGDRMVVPNVKENRASWSFHLDMPVEDVEQLIFVLNHGLAILFDKIGHLALSTEQLDVSFKLSDKTTRLYEIKTSFPTLDRSFWLKLANLRVAIDPPQAAITAVEAIAHFTKPRPSQRGLYAVSRPEPENLLLTVNKLKKLVGEENVGLPVLLNQRLAEAFTLDPEAIPDVSVENFVSKKEGEKRDGDKKKRLSRSICGEARLTDEAKNDSAAMPLLIDVNGGTAVNPFQTGTEKQSFSANRAAEPPILTLTNRGTNSPVPAEKRGFFAVEASRPPVLTAGFNYFRPPLSAEVSVENGRLIFVRTRYFSGPVAKYSGVWKGSSVWWDNKHWQMLEWDIEVEDDGVYRLCKAGNEWFITGEYD